MKTYPKAYPAAYATLDRLRDDAIARGAIGLAIVYGFSLMRMGAEVLEAQLADLKQMAAACAAGPKAP